MEYKVTIAENYCFQLVSCKYLATTVEASQVEFISKALVYAVYLFLMFSFADTSGLLNLDLTLKQ
jgi:hypothetical protein